MKVIYIGKKDKLAEAFIEKMNKEGNDVYFLSKEEFTGRLPVVLKHRFYKLSDKKDTLMKTITSISPDNIVFAGDYLMDSKHDSVEESDLLLLSKILECIVDVLKGKFIYLSSCEVYERSVDYVTEESEKLPQKKKGMLYDRGEYLVRSYQQRYEVDAVIVRTTQLYASQCDNTSKDFLSRAFFDVMQQEKISVENEILQPLHVQDFVEALQRIMELGKQKIYNVAGSFEVTKRELYDAVIECQKVMPSFLWEWNAYSVLVDSGRIKSELEWTDFRKLLNLLECGEIQYKKEKEKTERQKRKKLSNGLYRLLENVTVFVVFFAAYSLFASHSLFSKIDWMLIYVMLISLFFGIRQSALAVLLSSAAFLYHQDLSILEMTNFYSYAESVLMIVQFVFFGLSISYTSDMIREELRDTKRRLQMLEEENDEQKEINEENVLIKKEYEKRLLESKYSIPKLYDVVKRLMILQPDRIFMEILQVIAELVHTNTVAVYMVNEGSDYLRLLNAMNDASVIGGKSWDISSMPGFLNAIQEGELYQGDIWNKEPAIVVPIMVQNKCRAVIVIKELGYENHTLYQMNLLRTLLLLLTQSVERALEYERITKDERYIKDTGILKSEVFYNMVELAKEKAEKGIADYCILEINVSDNFKSYDEIASQFRLTDYFGMDEQGKLYVLLGNTGKEEVDNLLNRLWLNEVEAEISQHFNDIGA